MIPRTIPQNVVDIIETVVDRVNDSILDQLRNYRPQIVKINYQYGTPQEVANLLSQWAQGSLAELKYPIIWLVCNFAETDNGIAGVDKEVSLTIIIATSTSPDLSTKKRYEYNFNPILIPIYKEFIYQLQFVGAFANAQQPKHKKVIEAYWGRDGILGRDGKDIFHDKIDAILITDLQLTLKQKTCRT